MVVILKLSYRGNLSSRYYYFSSENKLFDLFSIDFIIPVIQKINALF